MAKIFPVYPNGGCFCGLWREVFANFLPEFVSSLGGC